MWCCIFSIATLLHSIQLLAGKIIEHSHSVETRPSGYDYIKNIKAAIEYDLKDKRVVKCYQCVYSPPRYETKLVARRGAKGTELVNVTTEIQGGWEPCKGPFTNTEARQHGIDAGHCLSNCYTRLDHLGNMLRGCYRDEYGVNPNVTGCHQQAGYIYCFCEGDRCNRHLPTEALASDERNDLPPDVSKIDKTYDEPYEKRNHDRPGRDENERSHRPVQEEDYHRYRYASDRNYPNYPNVREYHDKNSYTYLKSKYEKEVKKDHNPITRYRSVSEYGREVPSAVYRSKNRSRSYKSDDARQLRDSDVHSSVSNTYSEKEQESERNKYFERKQHHKDSHAEKPKRYQPSYHSYSSEFAAEYNPKRKEERQRNNLDKGQVARPHITTAEPIIGNYGNRDRSNRYDGHRYKQLDSVTRTSNTNKDKTTTMTDYSDIKKDHPESRSWEDKDEFLTEPEDTWRYRSSRYNDDKKNYDSQDTQASSRDGSHWLVYDNRNMEADIVSKRKVDERKEKSGLYDNRWFF